MASTGHIVKKALDRFFSSVKWTQVIDRLQGTNPIVFVIVKQAGGVNAVIVKAGESFMGVEPESLAALDTEKIGPAVVNNIHRVIKNDIIAGSPTPKIIGLESHEPDQRKEKVASAPVSTGITGPSRPPLLDPDYLVHKGPPPETEPIPSANGAAPTALLETPEPAQDNGEVDLQVGMRVIFTKDGTEQEGEIRELFEEEGQLLVSMPGTKKKDIIDAQTIKRIA